jgi:hypothetical protein
MGYLIDQGFIKKETFFIRSADAQNMDATSPYVLKTISGSYFIPIAANIELDSNTFTSSYSGGWSHLHLSLNDTTFANPCIFASLSVNAVLTGAIERNFNYQFIMNFQPSPPAPNRFGSNIFRDADLYIWWDSLPLAGDSGIYLNVYYVNENFR